MSSSVYIGLDQFGGVRRAVRLFYAIRRRGVRLSDDAN